jgi:hypothetical protein
MIPLSALDVGRDVFDIVFVLKSDVEPTEIGYFLEIEQWDEYGIKVFINFTNSMLISKGLSEDEVICTVLNKNLF